MPSFEVGEAIPPDTAHAVSVSLPTWQSNVDYEEGEQRVLSRMVTGYPRFFIHRSIEALALDIVARHGPSDYRAMLFPIRSVADRCLQYVHKGAEDDLTSRVFVIDLALDTSKDVSVLLKKHSPSISAVLLPPTLYPLAKQYWQHTGDGISSRRAEFCHGLFKDKLLVPTADVGPNTSPAPVESPRPLRGPKRYLRPASIDSSAGPVDPPQSLPDGAHTVETSEGSRFLEERFGRNLDMSLVQRARSAIRRRIAGSLLHEADSDDRGLSNGQIQANRHGMRYVGEDDVYLFPAGMNAIFNTHRALLAARKPQKSINFGFPYVDTLKILQKFGPGCLFYGHASAEDLDDLEFRLQNGERFMALFCEFPGNPLLACPDLLRIRKLADEFDFVVVVDETIGTFANVNVLHVADIVVTSLTKIFSGDANVMGGAAILNVDSKHYHELKKGMEEVIESTLWPEDIVFLERNSRDFLVRVDRININAEAICDVLRQHPLVKKVYYPKFNPSKVHYDACRLPSGGYGGLLSVVFHHKVQAQAFYDSLETAKGPSLGTNFTLCSPYVVLAHYAELAWASQFGVDPDLVRVSVGLEDTEDLRRAFHVALKAVGGGSVK